MINKEWKFKEYSMYNAHTDYYNLRKLMSFNKQINMVIGSRGYGKTFAVKQYCVNRFMSEGQQFVWACSTNTQKDKLTADNGSKFFEDVPQMDIPGYMEGKIRGERIYINGEPAGWIMPTSVFQNYKGNAYNNIKIFVFDEFIPEIGTNRNDARLWNIINSMSTVIRSRKDVKCFFMANALDRGDPFLEFLGVDIKDFGFYKHDYKNVCLHYSDNSARFNKINSEGIVGRLVMGTPLEANLMQGEFVQPSDLMYTSKPSKCKLMFIVEGNITKARFYFADGIYYVEYDNNPDTYLSKRYYIDLNGATKWKPVLPGYIKKKIKENVEANNIMYQNEYLRKFVINEIL